MLFSYVAFSQPLENHAFSDLKIKVKIHEHIWSKTRSHLWMQAKSFNAIFSQIRSSSFKTDVQTSLRSKHVVSPQLRHSNRVHGQAWACYDTARDKETYSIDQTNRYWQPRVELKWAWTHEQKGWMEPTGEVDQGRLVPSGLWHFLELSRTDSNITQTEDNEILDPEVVYLWVHCEP